MIARLIVHATLESSKKGLMNFATVAAQSKVKTGGPISAPETSKEEFLQILKKLVAG